MSGVLGAIATNIPWWMAAAVVGLWLAAVWAIALLARSRHRLARGRRATVLPARRSSYDEAADDRGLPERTDPIRELGSG